MVGMKELIFPNSHYGKNLFPLNLRSYLRVRLKYQS